MDTKTGFPVAAQREQFPALGRLVEGQPAVFFDGPAGSQVPARVPQAMSDYLLNCNTNRGGVFATSQESDALLTQASQAAADFLGTSDPGLAVFGQNMTSLTFHLARSLAKTWDAESEIIVSRLDHDANVTPWILAARDAGATVHHIDFHAEDCTLDLEQYRSLLSERTKLVAFGCASNAVGTINPIRDMISAAHAVGSLVFLDAVHYAPHALPAVEEWDCDFLACSAYKFFGPHLGILWGKRKWLEELDPYKLRPAPNTPPGRWMTGTQGHESIAGTMAAIDYLADLGRTLSADQLPRRAALQAAYAAIGEYERELMRFLLAEIQQIPDLTIYGITNPEHFDRRFATVAFTHAKHTPKEVAIHLAERGIFVWHGNYYALPVTEHLGLEPNGMVRVGLLHYNTKEEVERLIAALRELA